MLTGQRRDAAKVLILVPLATICALFSLNSVGLVSFAFETRLSVHSLLVYWAAIPSAFLIIALYKGYSRSKVFFASALLFAMSFQIVQAVSDFLMGHDNIPIGPSGLLNVLLEFSIFSALLVCGFLFKSKSKDYAEAQDRFHSVIMISVLPLVLYGLTYYMIIALVPIVAQRFFAIGISVIAIISFLRLPALASRTRNGEPFIDIGYLSTASVLLALATLLTLFSYLESTEAWVIGESLQIASYLMFGFSICIPFLRQQLFQRVTSYLIVVALALAT